MRPSFGFFTNSTFCSSKRAHAASTSGTKMPMCPNPRGSVLPVWYFWSGSDSLPQLLHKPNIWIQTWLKSTLQVAVTESIRELPCGSSPSVFDLRFGSELRWDSRSPENTAKILPRQNQSSAEASFPKRPYKRAAICGGPWCGTLFVERESPARKRIEWSSLVDFDVYKINQTLVDASAGLQRSFTSELLKPVSSAIATGFLWAVIKTTMIN